MGNNKEKKEVDADILESRADILKAQAALSTSEDEQIDEISEPQEIEKPEKSVPYALRPIGQTVQHIEAAEDEKEDIAEETVEETEPEEPIHIDIIEFQEKAGSVPEFNLAERILAEQRKSSSTQRQRKSPGERKRPVSFDRGIDHVVSKITRSVESSACKPRQAESENAAAKIPPSPQKIIYDIVSADIARLYNRA